MASIYGMVENVDDNVGRVLTYVRKNNLEENTIIIFLSDNGPNGVRFNGVMKGIKGSVHEGGVHVPFFISWKNKIPAGAVIETPMAHIDIFPTLRDLCDLHAIPGKPLDGISMASMILDGKEISTGNREIFTHVNFMELPVTVNSGGFRNDRYRFAFEKNTPQLYDLVNDPSEENDISKQNEKLFNEYLKDYKDWFDTSTAGLKVSRPIVLSSRGVELPVYEARLSEGIKYKEGHGWAHDWVEKWNSTSDSISWEIDCEKAGNYVVEMDYLCKQPDVGSTIECTIGNERKIANVFPAFYSKQIPSPDRVPRKEAYEIRAWKSLNFGKFFIHEGKNTITLRALKIPNSNVAEVNLLRLRFVN